MINSHEIIKELKMAKVEQLLPKTGIRNSNMLVREKLDALKLPELKPGMRIAVAVGSRGIKKIDEIVCETVNYLKRMGGQPFIVPAMGSHGGACEEGQISVLRELGITPEKTGVPFEPSMEVVRIGEIEGVMPVYFSKHAAESDALVLINRIKPHTNFRGQIESGLAKMLVVGLGKHAGASSIHQLGFEKIGQALPLAAKVIMNKVNILFGIAITESSNEEISEIEITKGEQILSTDRRLLRQVKKNMAYLPFKKIDVLIVDEIGKNISGDGMDTNIIGRYSAKVKTLSNTPDISRIIVSDLSGETHGNAIGIGYADFTTKRVMNKADLNATYINAMTANAPNACKIPIVMESDMKALDAALKTCVGVDFGKPKIVRIRNTLEIGTFLVSEWMKDEVSDNSKFRFMGEFAPIAFDRDGNYVNE